MRKMTTLFPLGHGQVATNPLAHNAYQFPRFRLGMVKLQRWLSSREPQCLSVKDLLSTASTAKTAVG